MTKVIIKEILIVIMFLILLAILFAILFYDYIPTNKVLPAKVVPYQLSNEIQEELETSISAGDNIIRSYQIDSQDLKIYESTKDYSKGKINPFEKEATEPIEGNTANNTTDIENNIIINKTINK